MSPARRDTLLAALALALLVLAVFAPTFAAGLVNWDDEPGIARNHAFRGLDGEALAWMFTTHTLGHFQPLSWLSLACDHALWGLGRGLDAPEAGRWHATSVLLHLAVALAFLGLARDVLRIALPRASERARLLAALFAAALFAVHPLRAESVAWLTERRDVLSGLFFVLALRAGLRAARSESASPVGVARVPAALGALAVAAAAAALALGALDLAAEPGLALRPHGALLLALAVLAWALSGVLGARATGTSPGGAYAATAALALLSLLAKAWGMVLPAVLIVLDVFLLARLGRERRGARALALLAEKAPLWVLSVVFARLAAWAQGSEPGTMLGVESHTLSERALQAAHGLVWYPLKTLVPTDLVAFVELPAEVRLGEARFALALGALVLVALALVALRRRAPALVAAALCYAVIVSPVLGLAQSGAQLVADRYSYLSGLPLVLAAAGAVLALALARPAWTRGLAWTAGLVVVALAFAGRAQARTWRDSRTLWSHALARDPSNSFAAVKLAQALLLEGKPEEADLARAAELLRSAPRPVDPVWHATVAQAQLALGRARPDERAARLGEALAAAERVRELQAGRADPDARLVVGTVLLESGRAAEAAVEFEAFTVARPAESVGWTNLGASLAATGRFAEAVRALERALSLEPDYAKAWQFLAQARERTGDRAGALAAWREVLRLWPDSAQARARMSALGG